MEGDLEEVFVTPNIWISMIQRHPNPLQFATRPEKVMLDPFKKSPGVFYYVLFVCVSSRVYIRPLKSSVLRSVFVLGMGFEGPSTGCGDASE